MPDSTRRYLYLKGRREQSYLQKRIELAEKKMEVLGVDVSIQLRELMIEEIDLMKKEHETEDKALEALRGERIYIEDVIRTMYPDREITDDMLQRVSQNMEARYRNKYGRSPETESS